MQKYDALSLPLRFHVQDHLAVLGELDGIAQEVDQNLPQAMLIAFQGVRNIGPDLAGQFQPLDMRPQGQGFEDRSEAVAQPKVLRVQGQLTRFDLGKIQDVVEHGQKRLGRGFDGAQKLPLLAGDLGVQEQLGHAQNAVHGGADFMAHIGQEFAFGAAGGFGGLFGLEQFRLDPFALADFHKRHHRAHRHAFFHHGVGPVFGWETAAVGAVQDLVLDMGADACAGGLLDAAVGGGKGAAVRSRMVNEAVHVLAEKVFHLGISQKAGTGRIAEHALAGQVDAVNRLGGRIQQQLELLLEVGFTRRNFQSHEAEGLRELGHLVVAPGQGKPGGQRALGAEFRGVAAGQALGAVGQAPQGAGDLAHENQGGQHADQEQRQQQAHQLANPGPHGDPDRLALHAHVDESSLTVQDGAAHVDAISQPLHMHFLNEGVVRIALERPHLRWNVGHEGVGNEISPVVLHEDVGEAGDPVLLFVDHGLDGGRVPVQQDLDAGCSGTPGSWSDRWSRSRSPPEPPR